MLLDLETPLSKVSPAPRSFRLNCVQGGFGDFYIYSILVVVQGGEGSKISRGRRPEEPVQKNCALGEGGLAGFKTPSFYPRPLALGLAIFAAASKAAALF